VHPPQSIDSQPRPVYHLGSASPAVSIPGHESVPVRDVDDLLGRRPGIVLLDAALPGEELVRAVQAIAATPGPWLALLTANGSAVPISLGWPADPAELARWADGADDADVFELRHVLARVARARHDLNNPLTSAMAETQLALMDAEDTELRAGLEVIEEQLRRMRDLIAALKAIRAPTP